MTNFSTIILAAGLSSRMRKQKALLPWKGTTLIQYQIEQMKIAGIDHIYIVLGYRAKEIQQVIDPYDIHIVHNENYLDGKSSSIRTGAASLKENPKGIFIVGVDQPVPAKTVKQLMEHLNKTDAPAIIPTYKEKRGHPLLLSGRLHNELLRVNEETKGLRRIIQLYEEEINYFSVKDRSVLFNFNRLEEYEKHRS